MRDFGELLPHVFMADVTRLVVNAVAGTAVPPWVASLMKWLEKELAIGDPALQELIGASFAENLRGCEHAQDVLRPLMGPHLLNLIDAT